MTQFNINDEQFYDLENPNQATYNDAYFLPYNFPLIPIDNSSQFANQHVQYQQIPFSTQQMSLPQSPLPHQAIFSVPGTPSSSQFGNFDFQYSYDQVHPSSGSTAFTSVANPSQIELQSANENFIPVYVTPNHLKNSEGRYICQQCEKTYTQIKHLKRHLLKHTGQKPYKCDYCDLTFARSDSKARHMIKCIQTQQHVQLPSSHHSHSLSSSSSASFSYSTTSIPSQSSSRHSKADAIPKAHTEKSIREHSRHEKKHSHHETSKSAFNDDTSNIFKVSARYTNNPAAYAATKAIFKCTPQKPSFSSSSTTLNKKDFMACQGQFQLNVKRG